MATRSFGFPAKKKSHLLKRVQVLSSMEPTKRSPSELLEDNGLPRPPCELPCLLGAMVHFLWCTPGGLEQPPRGKTRCAAWFFRRGCSLRCSCLSHFSLLQSHPRHPDSVFYVLKKPEFLKWVARSVSGSMDQRMLSRFRGRLSAWLSRPHQRRLPGGQSGALPGGRLPGHGPRHRPARLLRVGGVAKPRIRSLGLLALSFLVFGGGFHLRRDVQVRRDGHGSKKIKSVRFQ